MNKQSTFPLLAVPLISAVLILQGCSAPATSENNSLSTFLAVHNEYCEAEYISADEMVLALKKDTDFEMSGTYDGIFESEISKISYAVSPEESGCTTDLKIRTASSGQPYFGFEDINAALLSKGYKVTGEKEIRKELGLDNNELTVVEQTYESKNNKLTTLVFPLENEDQYYMTLFVEKFEIQGASVKVSAPALVEI